MQGAGEACVGFKQVLLILKQVALHLHTDAPVLIFSEMLSMRVQQSTLWHISFMALVLSIASRKQWRHSGIPQGCHH